MRKYKLPKKCAHCRSPLRVHEENKCYKCIGCGYVAGAVCNSYPRKIPDDDVEGRDA